MAVASSIAASHSGTLVHHGYATAAALTGGFHWALWVCGLTGLAAIPIAFALIRRPRKADVIATARSQDLVDGRNQLRGQWLMMFDHWPLFGLRVTTLLQRHRRHRADWSADDWSLDLAVFADGQVVGEQDMSAHDYPVLREVSTFSWVGVRHHGRGIGTEMRAAALHLAFAGLGATNAVSGAFADNVSSLRVSEKLGYQADGIERLAAHSRSPSRAACA